MRNAETIHSISFREHKTVEYDSVNSNESSPLTSRELKIIQVKHAVNRILIMSVI